MSGIVGSLNTRGSGLINLGSATDGTVFTGTGAGLPAGFEAAAGGGKLLQVVSVTNNTYTASTSTSWVTSNLTAAITPAATSSKILIIANITLYFTAASVSSSPGMTIFRGTVSGTNLGDASHGFAYYSIGSGIGSGSSHGSQGLNYLDSPSTTSSQTYTIGLISTSGDNLVKGSNGEPATMTLMEIGA